MEKNKSEEKKGRVNGGGEKVKDGGERRVKEELGRVKDLGFLVSAEGKRRCCCCRRCRRRCCCRCLRRFADFFFFFFWCRFCFLSFATILRV
jgi:hypothetical protein